MTTIVDTQVHIGLTKFKPVEDLIAVMEQHGVDKAVLVQYGGNYDNTYLAECARRFPGRFATVGLVDVTQPDAPAALERWVKDYAIGGLRLPPAARTPGPDPYALWAKIAELGIVANVSGDLAQFSSPEMAALVQRFPQLKMRIEHMGGALNAGEAPPFASLQPLLRLADYPNVYITFSGFYDWSREPYPYTDTLPLIRLVYQAFGSQRITWGSDWPSVENYEGYARALEFALQHIPYASAEDRAWIMGKTAAALWQF